MSREGILTSRAGSVQLLAPAALAENYDPAADPHISTWEVLHHLIRALESRGLAAAGSLLRDVVARPDGAIDPDLIKELAHLLYRVAEGNSWTKDALSFNTLVTSWPEVMDAAGTSERHESQQELDLSSDDS